jgi:hypothetical protein
MKPAPGVQRKRKLKRAKPVIFCPSAPQRTDLDRPFPPFRAAVIRARSSAGSASTIFIARSTAAPSICQPTSGNGLTSAVIAHRPHTMRVSPRWKSLGLASLVPELGYRARPPILLPPRDWRPFPRRDALHPAAFEYLLAILAQLCAIFLQTLLNRVVVAQLFTAKTLGIARARLLLVSSALMVVLGQ